MALVLVLAALALISFLVLVILTMARTEDRTATADAEISDVRTLAEMPTQIVISQFRNATKQLGVHYTWASQPGMIRLYGNGVEGNSEPVTGTPRVKATEYYKLYSSKRMTEDSSYDPTKAAEEVDNWSSNPAQFTNLNEPVEITPTQVSRSKSQKETTEKTYVYPILDPSAIGSVDGFTVSNTSSNTSPVAMPVRWLYVLKDGRVVAPTSGSGPKASFGNGPSADNPIVGRIAFWADDESCKLNINTASEPAPWDTPRTNSKTDHLYAENQPARNEFHRQSGHPAFTALSPVFKSFGVKGTNRNNIFTPKADPDFDGKNDVAFRDYINAVHHLLPRSAKIEPGSQHGTETPQEAAKLNKQRLYSTVDELLFSTDTDSDGNRQPHTSGPDGTGYIVTQEDINKARFFLTTKNSAPETNLFNRPKMSLWTVQALEQGEVRRTTFDLAMSYAAATRNRETGEAFDYFFQRVSPWTNADAPGASQSDSLELLGESNRNNQLHGFLRSLTTAGTSVPGYLASFLSKYGAKNSDQIITSMFDMLRWGVNIEQPAENGQMAYHYTPPGHPDDDIALLKGEHSAVPLNYDSLGTKGFGRFPTITGVSVIFVATEIENNRPKKMRAFVAVQPFMPAVGSPSMAAVFRYKIRWGSEWKIGFANGQERSLGFKPAENESIETINGLGHVSLVSFNPQSPANGSLFPPSGGHTAHGQFVAQFVSPTGAARGVPAQTADPSNDVHESLFPFVSHEIELPADTTAESKLKFTAGEVELQIQGGLAAFDKDRWLQTCRISFPNDDELPVPSGTSVRTIDSRFTSAGGRLPLIQEGDVVRSVSVDIESPARGDFRLLAAQSYCPEIDAATGRRWFNAVPPLTSDGKIRHALFDGRGPQATDFGLPLIPGGAPMLLGSDPNGFVPLDGMFFNPERLIARLGDWDNGSPAIEDGAYVSRMEFGNTPNEEGTGGYFSRGGDYVSDIKALNFAPLRQISSAISFGSLPSFPHAVTTGANVSAAKPWTTLLFCPNPSSRVTSFSKIEGPDGGDHFGFGLEKGTDNRPVLPDHLWLDFFWMPVIEPRPLSVGFSTEGKVNMNCEIMPFSWIKRRSALYGALEGVRIPAIHWQQATPGTSHFKAPGESTVEYRYKVSAEQTAKAFDELRFKKGEIFRTPSEICEMPLVPKKIEGRDYGSANGLENPTWQETNTWWNGEPAAVDAFEATGDNTREAPYAQLYPRLCTKSNVFRVHYRVQLLKKSRSTSPAEWDESKDSVAAEYRGSSVVERYLDPNDTDIPDMMDPRTVQQLADVALDDYFRFRVVEKQPFVP